MFEAAEINNKLSKSEFKQLEPEIHQLLLHLQAQLRQSRQYLIILVAGVEGAGKGEVVDRLNRWFDTRDVQTHAFWEETDEERQRPRFWRFWQRLPKRGSTAIMFGSWYTQPLVAAAFDQISNAEMEQELRRILEFERTLTTDGAIIVKLWFHLPKSVQQQRLETDKEIGKFKKSPLLTEFSKKYDQFREVSERALRLTDSGAAPWHIVEATDTRFRDVTSGNHLIRALQSRLLGEEENTQSAKGRTADELGKDVQTYLAGQPKSETILDCVDLSQQLNDDDYDELIEQRQARLYELAWELHRQRRNAVLVFEGWDAGGKGSAIRRLTSAMDARLYRVIPIAAPTDEELDHHYLWRFWRHVPRAGYLTLYDRSWYGRVLVERVEGFASPDEWLRSYREINDFEEHLVNHGTVLCKFWIHISKEEQLRRLKAREQDPRKQHKITEEDWRNREKWDDYQAAVNDMVAHTSNAGCPWTLVAGNDKKFARIQILDTVCDRLDAVLDVPAAQS